MVNCWPRCGLTNRLIRSMCACAPHQLLEDRVRCLWTMTCFQKLPAHQNKQLQDESSMAIRTVSVRLSTLVYPTDVLSVERHGSGDISVIGCFCAWLLKNARYTNILQLKTWLLGMKWENVCMEFGA